MLTNHSLAVFLINQDVRCVAATYEAPGPNGTAAPRTLFKTLDPDLKAGDLAVVPTGTRHGFTIVKIEETDLDVDFNSPTKMDWIAGAFDPSAHFKTLADEGEALKRIRSAEQRQKREELAAALVKDKEALSGLAIATIDTKPIEPPAASAG